MRLARHEGLKQAELAEMLDLQPITLTHLLDRLAQSELIERRPDPDDRRAKRLFLRPAAQPLLEQLGTLGEDLMGTALAGLGPERIEALLADLDRREGKPATVAIQKKEPANPEQRYG